MRAGEAKLSSSVLLPQLRTQTDAALCLVRLGGRRRPIVDADAAYVRARVKCIAAGSSLRHAT